MIRWNLQKGYSVVISSDDVLNIKDLKVLDFNVSPKDMEKLDTLNARPVNPLKSPDCIFNYWMLENELYKKEVIKKVQFNFLLPLIKWKNKTPDVSKLYLFGFLPIMKFKISSFNNDIENFYLFNFIPILKSKKICNNAKNRNNSHKKKYYLFGIIPLFKKSLDMRFYRYKNNVIPNYDIETSLERKHANRSDRDYIFNQIHVSQKLYGYKKYTKLQDYFIKLRLKYAKKAIIAHQNVQVTNICTIKCAQCAHMIPYYKKENLHTMNFLEFKDYIDTLTKNVNRVYDMVLLGGEPLLNKDIAKMVKYSKKQRKIERTIIVTNASVIPSDELIKELKGAKNASIYISNYSKNVPKLQENFEKIVQLCKDNNIICNFVESYYWWQQPEIVIKEPKDIDKNLAQSNYERCSFKYCMMLSNGKMYPCARAVYINDEAGKKFDYEMLDFKKKNFTCDDFNKFISAEEFDICGCCDMKNYEKILLPAQQINNCKKQ